jgi:hypothetical protein
MLVVIARLAEAAHLLRTVALTRSLQSLPNLGVSSLDLGRSPRRTAFLCEVPALCAARSQIRPLPSVSSPSALQKTQLLMVQCNSILCIATLRFTPRRALLGRFLPRLGPFAFRTALFFGGSGNGLIQQPCALQTTKAQSQINAPQARSNQIVGPRNRRSPVTSFH